MFTGILIYLGYSIRHSIENQPLSVYSQVISYGGDAETVVPKMHEKVSMPQPGQKSPSTDDDATEADD